MGVETFAPEGCVVPEVCANRDAEVVLEEVSFGAGLEVAWIVEDVVFGQQRFVGKAEQLLIANHGGGGKETAAGGLVRRSDSADDRGDSFSGFDDLFERLERAALHVAIEKPVERRVAL